MVADDSVSTSTITDHLNGLAEKIQPPSVVLGTGPPTKEELDAFYPGKFTFDQLKLFINVGDLGLLKRDKALQKRYDAWTRTIRERYGSVGKEVLCPCLSIKQALTSTPPRSRLPLAISSAMGKARHADIVALCHHG